MADLDITEVVNEVWEREEMNLSFLDFESN